MNDISTASFHFSEQTKRRYYTSWGRVCEIALTFFGCFRGLPLGFFSISSCTEENICQICSRHHSGENTKALLLNNSAYINTWYHAQKYQPLMISLNSKGNDRWTVTMNSTIKHPILGKYGGDLYVSATYMQGYTVFSIRCTSLAERQSALASGLWGF